MWSGIEERIWLWFDESAVVYMVELIQPITPPWSHRRAGQPLLLPLTDSLYVSGTLESVDTVLLEVGTGYFVEVSS